MTVSESEGSGLCPKLWELQSSCQANRIEEPKDLRGAVVMARQRSKRSCEMLSLELANVKLQRNFEMASRNALDAHHSVHNQTDSRWRLRDELKVFQEEIDGLCSKYSHREFKMVSCLKETGKWLKDEMDGCVSLFAKAAYVVVERAKVQDMKHTLTSNVRAFLCM